MSTMVAKSAKCANEVRVQRGVWQKWKDFNDHCDYYVVRMKNMHFMVCIRRRDTNATLAIDLVVDTDKPENEWYTRVRETEWKPGNRYVNTSKHKWHAAAALKALHTYAPKFGDWKAILNNCNTWVKGIVEFMKDDNKRAQCECEPIADDFDRLSSFGASLGVELTYLKSSEVKQPLTHPEVDEPEESTDQSELEEVQEHREGPNQSTNLTGSGGKCNATLTTETETNITEFNGGEAESTMTKEVDGKGQNIDNLQ